jgi:hypothetical protein
LRNNAGYVATNSAMVIAWGAWHLFALHPIANGRSSSADVSVDRVTVRGLSLTDQDFGMSPTAKLQLGKTTTGCT